MLEDIEERTIELINSVNSLWGPESFVEMKSLENKARTEFFKKQTETLKDIEAAELIKRQ